MNKLLKIGILLILSMHTYAQINSARPQNYQHAIWHRVSYFGHAIMSTESGKVYGVTTSVWNYNPLDLDVKVTAMGGGYNYLAVATTHDDVYASYDYKSWNKLGNRLDEDVTTISNGTMNDSPIYLGTETGKIYTLNQGSWVKLGFFRSRITAMEYDENGKILYFGEQNGKTFIYDSNAKGNVFKLLNGMNYPNKIISIVVSPNSRYAVAATASGDIYLKKPLDDQWNALGKINNERVTSLVRDTEQGEENLIYAGTKSGHVYQRDIVNGNNWVDVGAPGGNVSIVGMASPNSSILLTVMTKDQKVYEYNSYYKTWEYMGQLS